MKKSEKWKLKGQGNEPRQDAKVVNRNLANARTKGGIWKTANEVLVASKVLQK